MKNQVKKAVDDITAVLVKWDGVKAVVLQHFVEKDIYDPNFSISLDVFRDGEIPGREERQAAFPEAQYFESSGTRVKDRFMLSDLPVRISFKDCSRVDAVLAALDGDNWLFMERGTYLFHRIAAGTVVWTRDDWINGVLSRLDNLPDSFWHTWIESSRRRIDHFLSDMGAAAVKEDDLYFRLSLSGFLKSSVELLFAVNRVFEPGPRAYAAYLDMLEILPAGFEANWNSLIREDTELPPERKQEVAGLLARGLFSLGLYTQ